MTAAQVAIVPATAEHALALAPRLRLIDERGVGERFGLTPERVALEALARSIQAWALLVDGAVLALCGVSTPSVIAGRRDAWVLVARDVERRKKTFWRASRAMVAAMLDRYGAIECLCDADFRSSVTWLRRLGFTITGPFVIRNSGGISYVKGFIAKGVIHG